MKLGRHNKRNGQFSPIFVFSVDKIRAVSRSRYADYWLLIRLFRVKTFQLSTG